MKQERLDLSPKRVDQIFTHFDIENQLTEISKVIWQNPSITYHKSIIIEDKYSYQHTAKGYYIEQVADSLSGVSKEGWGSQIAVIIPLEDKEHIWIFSARNPIAINLNSRFLKTSLKSALHKQMRNPATFKDHEFGNQEPITPFFVGNFPRK